MKPTGLSKYKTQSDVIVDAWYWGGGKAEGDELVTFGKPGQLTLHQISEEEYIIRIKTRVRTLTAEHGVFITRDHQGDFGICEELLFYQIFKLV